MGRFYKIAYSREIFWYYFDRLQELIGSRFPGPAYAVMMDQSPSPSSVSTPLSSIPSPEPGKLHPSEAIEKDKQEAIRLKAEANKAFSCQ
jgi:hypothetical protein